MKKLLILMLSMFMVLTCSSAISAEGEQGSGAQPQLYVRYLNQMNGEFSISGGVSRGRYNVEIGSGNPVLLFYGTAYGNDVDESEMISLDDVTIVNNSSQENTLESAGISAFEKAVKVVGNQTGSFTLKYEKEEVSSTLVVEIKYPSIGLYRTDQLSMANIVNMFDGSETQTVYYLFVESNLLNNAELNLEKNGQPLLDGYTLEDQTTSEENYLCKKLTFSEAPKYNLSIKVIDSSNRNVKANRNINFMGGNNHGPENNLKATSDIVIDGVEYTFGMDGVFSESLNIYDGGGYFGAGTDEKISVCLVVGTFSNPPKFGHPNGTPSQDIFDLIDGASIRYIFDDPNYHASEPYLWHMENVDRYVWTTDITCDVEDATTTTRLVIEFKLKGSDAIYHNEMLVSFMYAESVEYTLDVNKRNQNETPEQYIISILNDPERFANEYERREIDDTSTFTVNIPAGYVLEGDVICSLGMGQFNSLNGNGTVIKGQLISNTYTLYIGNFNFEAKTANDVAIKPGTYDMDQHPGMFQQPKDFAVVDCTFNGYKTAIQSSDAGYASLIVNNEFKNCDTAIYSDAKGFHSIYGNGQSNISIDNNKFIDCQVGVHYTELPQTYNNTMAFFVKNNCFIYTSELGTDFLIEKAGYWDLSENYYGLHEDKIDNEHYRSPRVNMQNDAIVATSPTIMFPDDDVKLGIDKHVLSVIPNGKHLVINAKCNVEKAPYIVFDKTTGLILGTVNNKNKGGN